MNSTTAPSLSPLKLYGAEISFFTGKVRAYLRWKKLPFTEVLASAEVYRDLILPKVGFPVIPVVETATGEVLQDSTDIIDALERAHGGPSVVPATGVQRLVSALLELYGDEWLVIPAMHYRWHHNREWAQAAFGAVNAPGASAEEQQAIGAKRAVPFAAAAGLLGASTPAMQAAVERSYEALMAELDAHFAEHAFTLGSRPSIGDFGLYGPLYAHQYRDPYSGELMRRVAPRLAAWVERLRDDTAAHPGDFLPNDGIPASLEPVLRRQMREQLPDLASVASALNQWLATHPGEAIPRALGLHPFQLEGEQGERIARPYSLWMMQRARDVYLALQGEERVQADALLERVGGQAFQRFIDPPRLARRGLSVALAEG